jgi:Uma2 family endonuclease
MDMDTSFRSDERFTQAEFFEWVQERPASDLYRYELLGGHIVMTPPAGAPHGEVEVRISSALFQHVEPRRLGTVYGSSAGFELPSGDTIEPDVSFALAAKLATIQSTPDDGYYPFVPDLIVEILSRATARRDRTEKRLIYEKNGVREYWIVSHKPRQVTMYVLEGGSFAGPVHVVSGHVESRLLPGLRIPIDKIFGR